MAYNRNEVTVPRSFVEGGSVCRLDAPLYIIQAEVTIQDIQHRPVRQHPNSMPGSEADARPTTVPPPYPLLPYP